MLSAIYIKGFKTFARPVRMLLDQGSTVIVGPNGSGKSNITDAVLFALGEGSPGLLRAGSMGDLIFSGSDALPPAGAAEVTLVLDNATGHISLPYEEVSLTRRISRGGQTEYKINGARARLGDVRVVAGEAGLGRHSILRQGAVDAIVAGGAAACRTALEEAAGLGVFRRRRLAASRKLERAAAQLESSVRLEAELSDQLRRIEAEAVAAREYREIEARYRELSLAHLYRIATQDLEEARERLADLDTRVDVLRTRQASLREEGRRLGEGEKELEDGILAAERVYGDLERGSEALRTETLRIERALLRLEGAQDWRTDRSRLTSRLQAELDKVSSRVRRLEKEVADLEEEHGQRKGVFGRSEELVARARVEHAAAMGRLTRLVGKLEVLRGKRKRATDRLREVDDSGNQELGRLGEIEERLSSYSSEGPRARCSAVLEQLEELRLSAARKATEANRRRGVLAALVGKTEAEIRTLRAPGRAATDGKRLHEVLRPRPGYEAAVEAALGNLAGGVLAKTLGEGMKLLSAAPEERVIVRLDAKKVPKNGAPPGKPLLDCVEILDDSYAGALERLLEGAYVLEKAHRTAPKSGYDVAVTREGLRFTRTSASRRASDGDFARQARLAQEEERLGVLKNRVGEELYDLQEAVSFIGKRLEERVIEIEALASLTSRAKRLARLIVQETGRRARKVQAAHERRAADEIDLREIGSELCAAEEELNGARRDEERAKEELNAALPAAEVAYDATQEAARQLAQARSTLQSDRERLTRISRRLAGLENVTTDDATARVVLARHAAEQTRRLDGAVRERLARLRHSRSEAAMLQVQAAKQRAEFVGEAGDVSGELARAQSEAAVLKGELSRAEEARKAAELEIFDEWGATLETAREAAETLPETANVERERTRLARKLKNFGDVNLLAIGQEGALRARHEFVAAQRSDAETAATEIQRIIQSVDREIEARFRATFREVREAFASMVPRMMEGAEGELGLSEEGVEIGLKLRRHGWRPLRVLSGGERSLLALAFLFGIFLGRSSGGPGAFCMLDEAEAALDDINLARFLAVVDSYRADGQFLLVTHQKRTMASADVLYGVTPDASGATVVVSKRLTGE